MTKPGFLPVMIVMLGFVPQPNLQNNVSLLSKNAIHKIEGKQDGSIPPISLVCQNCLMLGFVDGGPNLRIKLILAHSTTAKVMQFFLSQNDHKV